MIFLLCQRRKNNSSYNTSFRGPNFPVSIAVFIIKISIHLSWFFSQYIRRSKEKTNRIEKYSLWNVEKFFLFIYPSPITRDAPRKVLFRLDKELSKQSNFKQDNLKHDRNNFLTSFRSRYTNKNVNWLSGAFDIFDHSLQPTQPIYFIKTPTKGRVNHSVGGLQYIELISYLSLKRFVIICILCFIVGNHRWSSEELKLDTP